MLPLHASLPRSRALVHLALLFVCCDANWCLSAGSEGATSDASETDDSSESTASSEPTASSAPTTGGPDLCGNATCDAGEAESCPSDCVDCGNGVVDGGEACDDKNDDDGDDCTNSCTAAVCGDGIVWDGHEVCDDGDDASDEWTPTERCKSDCQGSTAFCGDGTCQAEFEDVASCPQDGCAAVCGNGKVEGDEVCDDGNDADDDACLAGCIAAVCGDGVVRTGVEDCDDANSDNTDACLNSCKAPSCGDGFVQDGVEDCDDSNRVNDDACSNECARPRRVFVTSVPYKGNLMGLMGADEKCQGLAEAAKLGGTFVAWLSDGTASPLMTRLDSTFTGSYQLVDGTVVASNGWADLTDGELAHAIDLDEKQELTEENVWTNTDTQGQAIMDGPDCTSWAVGNNTVKATHGDTTATGTEWTVSSVASCGSSYRLYCFENP